MSFETPSPSEFPMTFLGVGMDIFWSHTFFPFVLDRCYKAVCLQWSYEVTVQVSCWLRFLLHRDASFLTQDLLLYLQSENKIN